MSTYKRRRSRVLVEPFSDAHREQLETGFDLFRDAYGDPTANQPVFGRDGKTVVGTTGPAQRPFDEALARRHWQEHGEEIMAAWLARHGAASRPWAWWQFESPEPRRVLGNDRYVGVGYVPGRPRVIGAVYESEADALRRMGLA